MLIGFSIPADGGGTHYGIAAVAPDTLRADTAKAIAQEYGVSVEGVVFDYDVEALIDSSYGGMALLTTSTD